MAGLFDYYRVAAMKMKFVPTVTADATYNFAPAYVLHDVNSKSLPSITTTTAIQYENCRIVNMQRPWKYCRKMIRNITDSSGSSTRGYIPTSEPNATQVMCMLHLGTDQAGKHIGDTLSTYYISAFARQ